MSLTAAFLLSSFLRAFASRRFLRTLVYSFSFDDEIFCLNSGLVSRLLVPFFTIFTFSGDGCMRRLSSKAINADRSAYLNDQSFQECIRN